MNKTSFNNQRIFKNKMNRTRIAKIKKKIIKMISTFNKLLKVMSHNQIKFYKKKIKINKQIKALNNLRIQKIYHFLVENQN